MALTSHVCFLLLFVVSDFFQETNIHTHMMPFWNPGDHWITNFFMIFSYHQNDQEGKN